MNDSYAEWVEHYPTIFVHIVTFSDYIEYLNWHYQSAVDQIFVRSLQQISSRMCDTIDLRTSWQLSGSASTQHRLVEVKDQVLSIQEPLHISTKTSEIIRNYSTGVALSPANLVKYSIFAIEPDFKLYQTLSEQLSRLIQRYNVLLTQGTTHIPDLIQLRTEFLSCRDKIKDTQHLSPHHKISLHKRIEMITRRLVRHTKESDLHAPTEQQQLPSNLLPHYFRTITISTGRRTILPASSQDYGLKGD